MCFDIKGIVNYPLEAFLIFLCVIYAIAVGVTLTESIFLFAGEEATLLREYCVILVNIVIIAILIFLLLSILKNYYEPPFIAIVLIICHILLVILSVWVLYVEARRRVPDLYLTHDLPRNANYTSMDYEDFGPQKLLSAAAAPVSSPVFGYDIFTDPIMLVNAIVAFLAVLMIPILYTHFLNQLRRDMPERLEEDQATSVKSTPSHVSQQPLYPVPPEHVEQVYDQPSELMSSPPKTLASPKLSVTSTGMSSSPSGDSSHSDVEKCHPPTENSHTYPGDRPPLSHLQIVESLELIASKLSTMRTSRSSSPRPSRGSKQAPYVSPPFSLPISPQARKTSGVKTPPKTPIDVSRMQGEKGFFRMVCTPIAPPPSLQSTPVAPPPTLQCTPIAPPPSLQCTPIAPPPSLQCTPIAPPPSLQCTPISLPPNTTQAHLQNFRVLRPVQIGATNPDVMICQASPRPQYPTLQHSQATGNDYYSSESEMIQDDDDDDDDEGSILSFQPYSSSQPD